jgi:hypothetical protein
LLHGQWCSFIRNESVIVESDSGVVLDFGGEDDGCSDLDEVHVLDIDGKELVGELMVLVKSQFFVVDDVEQLAYGFL